jgi:AcrR family transcriptional regulator
MSARRPRGPRERDGPSDDNARGAPTSRRTVAASLAVGSCIDKVYTPCIRMAPSRIVSRRRHADAPGLGTALLAAQAARGTILAAAAKVFSQTGVTETRVEDILLAAGLARRTFYKYFSGKEAVLAALYEVWTTEILKAIEAARSKQPDVPLAGIRAGIDIFLGLYRGGPRALREVVELAMRSDSLLAARRRWVRGELVKLLDDAVYALDRRRLDPFVYLGLVSALEGLALELGVADVSAAEVERARRVIHAVVDQTLGLPGGDALPRRRNT